MLRQLAILGLCAIGLGLAQAQDSVTLQNAFSLLRGKPAVFFRLQGTETLNNTTKPLLIDAYWDQATTVPARAKVQIFKNNIEVLRVIADGNALFTFDPYKNEYIVARYANVGGSTPANDNLLQSLVAQSQSASSFATTLLRDTFFSTGPIYKSWYPGVAPVETPQKVVYQDSPSNPSRKITFNLSLTGDLTSIDYYSASPVGNTWKTTSWTLTLYTFLSPPASWNFDFVPPAGSKAILGKLINS